MPSDTDLANRALRLLKAQRIESLTDGTKNANVASDVFEETREDLLRSHNWNFATSREKLVRSSTAPTYEFDYAYALPSDWIRTIAAHDNDAGTGRFLYREEEVDNQGVLVASVEDVYLRYVYRVTDPNRMPADFRTAFIYALAVAMPGIGNISVAREDRLEKRASRMLIKAKSADGMGPPERRPRGTWADSRGGWPDWRIWPR